MSYLSGKKQNQNKNNKASESDSVGEELIQSELFPDPSILSRPAYVRRITLAIVLLVFAASSWFCFIGPGATTLEANLRRLALQASVPPVFTFTPSKTPTMTLVVTKDVKEVLVQIPTATLQPSETVTEIPTSTSTENPTATVESSPTPIPIQNTPTPTSEVSGCVPAELVTLADVGKNLCVSGRVFRTISKTSSFLIVVVEEPQAFYFVAYDLTYDTLEKMQCVFANGEIRQLGNNPIMVLSYSVPLQYCP